MKVGEGKAAPSKKLAVDDAKIKELMSFITGKLQSSNLMKQLEEALENKKPEKAFKKVISELNKEIASDPRGKRLIQELKRKGINIDDIITVKSFQKREETTFEERGMAKLCEEIVDAINRQMIEARVRMPKDAGVNRLLHEAQNTGNAPIDLASDKLKSNIPILMEILEKSPHIAKLWATTSRKEKEAMVQEMMNAKSIPEGQKEKSVISAVMRGMYLGAMDSLLINAMETLPAFPKSLSNTCIIVGHQAVKERNIRGQFNGLLAESARHFRLFERASYAKNLKESFDKTNIAIKEKFEKIKKLPVTSDDFQLELTDIATLYAYNEGLISGDLALIEQEMS